MQKVFTVDIDTKYADFNGKTEAEIQELAANGHELATQLVSDMAEFPAEFGAVFQESSEDQLNDADDSDDESDEAIQNASDITSDLTNEDHDPLANPSEPINDEEIVPDEDGAPKGPSPVESNDSDADQEDGE